MEIVSVLSANFSSLQENKNSWFSFLVFSWEESLPPPSSASNTVHYCRILLHETVSVLHFSSSSTRLNYVYGNEILSCQRNNEAFDSPPSSTFTTASFPVVMHSEKWHENLRVLCSMSKKPHLHLLCLIIHLPSSHHLLHSLCLTSPLCLTCTYNLFN